VTFAPHSFAADWSLSPQWAFNRWLVAAAVLLAGAMVVYLYRAQQRVAPRRVVITLTALRLVLVRVLDWVRPFSLPPEPRLPERLLDEDRLWVRVAITCPPFWVHGMNGGLQPGVPLPNAKGRVINELSY